MSAGIVLKKPKATLRCVAMKNAHVQTHRNTHHMQDESVVEVRSKHAWKINLQPERSIAAASNLSSTGVSGQTSDATSGFVKLARSWSYEFDDGWSTQHYSDIVSRFH
jgi:hypothetical protein